MCIVLEPSAIGVAALQLLEELKAADRLASFAVV